MRTSQKIEKSGVQFNLKPMKRVLIALDYDPTALKIAETGFSFAKSMNAETILLHVVADAPYYTSLEYSPIMGFNDFNSAEFIKMIDIEGLKKASYNFLESVKIRLGDSTIQTLVEEGDLAEAILKTSKKLHADTVVMGSHSRRWLEQTLLGSATEKVLHHISIPLFIVPTKKHK
jgi:nucleotide-binding universal stress UspA family protein